MREMRSISKIKGYILLIFISSLLGLLGWLIAKAVGFESAQIEGEYSLISYLFPYVIGAISFSFSIVFYIVVNRSIENNVNKNASKRNEYLMKSSS